MAASTSSSVQFSMTASCLLLSRAFSSKSCNNFFSIGTFLSKNSIIQKSSAFTPCKTGFSIQRDELGTALFKKGIMGEARLPKKPDPLLEPGPYVFPAVGIGTQCDIFAAAFPETAYNIHAGKGAANLLAQARGVHFQGDSLFRQAAQNRLHLSVKTDKIQRDARLSDNIAQRIGQVGQGIKFPPLHHSHQLIQIGVEQVLYRLHAVIQLIKIRHPLHIMHGGKRKVKIAGIEDVLRRFYVLHGLKIVLFRYFYHTIKRSGFPVF